MPRKKGDSPQATSTSRVVVSVSPKAGSGRRGERIPALVERLRSDGYDVVVSDRLGAVHAACTDRPAGMELAAIVAAGGDGTVALVADSLPPGLPIVPLPLGTENLLARHFGYTSDPVQTAATIRLGQHRPIDAGSANGRLFLVMATCGFDAEVVRAMHLTRRGHIRRWSYAKPILRAVRTYQYPLIRVRSDEPFPGGGPRAMPEQTADGALTCRWAMVFNLPMYGGGLSIEPDAIPDDGKMNFVGLTQGCSRSTLMYVAHVYAGRLKRCQDLCAMRGTEWRWESDMRISYQVDGDYAGRLPVAIQTLPQRVTLLRPP